MLKRWLSCFVVAAFGVAAQAAGPVVTTEQVRAELVAHAPEGVAPGKPVWLGLAITHQPHWHTYWKNPGDSGLPTTLNWTLPAGVTAGEIAWPAPKRLPVGPLVNYGYEGRLLLPVPVSVGPEFKGASLEVRLAAQWLVCKDICIPQQGEFALSVPVQAASALHALDFDAAQRAAPRDLPATAGAEIIDGGRTLRVSIAGLPSKLHGRTLDFFAETAGVIEHAAKPAARWDGNVWRADVAVSSQRFESPASMHAVLVSAGDAAAVRVALPIAGAWPALAAPQTGAAVSAAAPPPPPALGFGVALLFALIGGALLNLMPCVFPILSLKVLGFTGHAHNRRALVGGSIAYSAGVVLSFVTLAAALLALRAGGEQIGWGFQLQSPPFIAALAVLFTVIALNLAGLFEFGSILPSGAAALRLRHPMADSFLTGVLAVAVASPCTAPFMGAALGMAFTMPAAQALSLFAVLGVGMALPYLLASAWPGLARALPRPGPWMATFKTAMAFPMLATVVWLVWVLGQQTGTDGVTALLAVLVALAFALWAWGRSDESGLARAVWTGVAVLLLGGTLAWALPNWREAHAAPAPSIEVDAHWQPWSAERVAAFNAEGRTVLVDFTAAWCVTCQFNKRTVLSDAALLADLDARRVVLLRADWTRRDAAISAELTRLNRSGVPVYAVYAPGQQFPTLLPEILTAQVVRGALALP